MIGGAIDPSFYSTEGAFNGSGIALASQSFSRDLADGTQGSIVMYFQHHTGQIRWKQLSTSGDWLGGDISEVVASNAKNNTPLSAVAYDINGSSTWHVFYIAKDNTIKQRTNSNVTNVWVDGPINAMNLQAMDADMVGLQACWYGNNYGDSDYDHTPLPNENPSANTSSEVGMHMWYAKDSSTFQQLGWRQGDDQWEFQQEFTEKNGHAGVGCYSWGPGTVTYVMMVNLEHTVEIWWKDTNTNLTNTTAHPINTWTNSSIAINNVHPSTSLGYTRFLYAQDDASLMFKGYNIAFAAENSTIDEKTSFTVQGERALPGSHLSVSAIPNVSGGDDVIVFYQSNGSDISEYTRDLYAGQWAKVQIEIPQ
ncbi:hypothetical protein CLAFUW4_05426 [Fulvia fulva]|uniref:uncharacterized protein n=1 Tax=Passalora fulva TaxID=5499 RepID=UPI0028529FCF|nr:uncharacterized protein CLAFUR5_20201 [Fulvia fulva]KAK4623830.1 hypothetical protein CLAFUR4_05420 [Fulvia fulva]KAK4625260.1 hypothetical protein CLAFUR0_05428 [Fulvia fulva]WMI38893.1 hypothetical protein CLAFUR5_20201 [Fulvia fulva]WPV14597.1 hypothetical protein CLAFUW4_05426 [Fulvia fulva]WPV30505.1 hypothetical protein CLAFUW7_05424 [Fulvia fulva]